MAESGITPVILSGGSGTRLWPLSRELYPKQLLSFSGGNTLLQETVRRLDGLTGEEVGKPLVVCNEESRFLVGEQMAQTGREPWKIILEPEGRSTAPALTLAALFVLRTGTDAVLLVQPADHVMRNAARFHAAIRRGAELARRGMLVTFGIKPTRAETGYGYIRQGKPLAGKGSKAYRLAAFVEKPSTNTARGYLKSRTYQWNSGIFMMLASSWVDQMLRHRPDIVQSCKTALERGKVDNQFQRVDAEAFKECPADSIDRAIMEKIASPGGNDAAVVRLDAGWSDVGTWPSLWDVLPKDRRGNVSRGDVFADDTRDSLLFAEHHLLAAIGLKDVIVVETADAVLVANKSHAHEVAQTVEWLKGQKRGEHLLHRKVYRPWGDYEGVDKGERYQVKRITVKPGAALSLQRHRQRAEHWIVVKGVAKVTRGEETFTVLENESTFIPQGAVHRLENPGTEPLELIEVQSGAYLGEDDIERLEDQYGREKR